MSKRKKLNEILKKIKKVFVMIDLEIAHCDIRIQTLNKAIERYNISNKQGMIRRRLNAKVEIEKLEMARENFIDFSNEIRSRILKEIKKATGKNHAIIKDYLTHKYSFDVVAEHFQMSEEDVEDIIFNFSQSLCHRLKYINFNNYFDV